MQQTWNHKKWLTNFLQASKSKAGFRELRSDVFENNIQIIEQGHYFIDDEKIELNRCNIAETMLYDKQICAAKVVILFKIAMIKQDSFVKTIHIYQLFTNNFFYKTHFA